MRNTRSPNRASRKTPKKSPDQWAQRHRLQHKSGAALDPKTSKRLGQEFERALQARGKEAAANAHAAH